MVRRNSEEGEASPPGALLKESVPDRLFIYYINSLGVCTHFDKESATVPFEGGTQTLNE